MASRDTAQLILEVDARIATAQRAVNQLARAIQQDAAGMAGAMGKVEQAGERVGKSLGAISARTRSGFTQLSFQIGDVTQQMAMGTRASTIFAQQSGQVIQALQVMGGEGNKFLQFLGGPWGLAISTGAVILGTLGTKLFETGNEVGALVDKMREQTRQAAIARDANKAWLDTYVGASENIEAVVRALDKQNLSLEDNIALTRQQLQQNIKTLEGQRTGLVAALAEKQKQLGQANSMVGGGFLDKNSIIQDMAAIGDELERLDARLEIARRGIREVGFEKAERDAKALVDPIAAINKRYDDMAAAAKRAAAGNDQLAASLTKTLAGIEKQREAALKAQRDKSSTDGDLTKFVNPVGGGAITGKFGESRPGHTHAGIDIDTPDRGVNVGAAAAGTIIEVGTLPGYGNVVIIDHGRGTTTRYAHLSQMLVSKGQQVTQGEVIGVSGGVRGAPGSGNSEGSHLHFEVRRNGRPVDPRKGAFPTDPAIAGQGARSSAESAAEKAIRQANAFAEESARLDQELLRAKSDLVQGVDAEADAAIAALQSEQERRKLAYDNDVKEGKISQANADILKAKVDQITFEKMKAVETQRSLQHMRRADELEQRQFQYRVDDLRFLDEQAKTQAAHRRIQLEILDVVYQQKEAHLRALKAELELAGKIEEAADVQAEIDRLPTEKDRDRSRVLDGTKNPLEAWADQVPQTAEEIIQALQEIEVRGIDGLADAMTDVIMGTKSLKEAFGDLAKSIIADLVRMIIKMLIFRALSAAIGGGFGGGGIGGPMSAGLGDVYSGSGLDISGFLATGGPVTAGKNYVVGEQGPELFVPSTSGTIIPNSKLGSAGSSAPVEILVTVAASAELDARVEQVSARTVGKAAPIIIKTAVNQVMRTNRPKLMGGRR